MKIPIPYCLLIISFAFMPGFAYGDDTFSASAKPIKILIVPGHDEEYSGAIYKDIREADLTLAISKKLAASLAKDPGLSVTVSRTDLGYIPELAQYFANSTEGIKTFMTEHLQETIQSVLSGEIQIGEQVPHNAAPELVAYRLYGISKWASEQHFDLILHVHFNDSWPRNIDAIGEYNGYTIYVPADGLLNAASGQALGEAIGNRFHETFYPSNLPLEESGADKAGAVRDFNLIALGARKTLSIPSILLEYSYIYEPILSPEFFSLTTDVMVNATKSGIYAHLGKKETNKNLKYVWSQKLIRGPGKKVDVLALQYALRELNYYPPALSTRDDCPITGIFGPCTEKAVKAFQKDKGLITYGIVGPQTRAILNKIFHQ